MNGYMDFNDAKKIVRKLKIHSVLEWGKYASLAEKPTTIPFHPDRKYANSGWTNWYDFLGKSKDQRKYKVNDDFFKTWSHDMAYILGFWWADGWMDEQSGLFSITQHKDDVYLLKNILSKMGSNHIIARHGENNLVFKIVSHEIIKDIKRYGAMERKSLKIEFPQTVPKKYLPDFIRGLWDGDGCVSYKKQGKHYVSCFSSASESLIFGLLKTLNEQIHDFNGKIRFNNNIYTLSVGANDTRRLRDYLYLNLHKNSLLLKRKYEKFKLAGEICIASYNRVFPSYENVRNLVRKHNIKGRADWKRYRLAHVSLNLPSDPQNTYKNKGWVNWTTFVGLRFLGFVDARKYVRSLGLKKYRDWKKYSASNRRIKNIPSCPWTVYNKEWKGLHDWLGINI